MQEWVELQLTIFALSSSICMMFTIYKFLSYLLNLYLLFKHTKAPCKHQINKWMKFLNWCPTVHRNNSSHQPFQKMSFPNPLSPTRMILFPPHLISWSILQLLMSLCRPCQSNTSSTIRPLSPPHSLPQIFIIFHHRILFAEFYYLIGLIEQLYSTHIYICRTIHTLARSYV